MHAIPSYNAMACPKIIPIDGSNVSIKCAIDLTSGRSNTFEGSNKFDGNFKFLNFKRRYACCTLKFWADNCIVFCFLPSLHKDFSLQLFGQFTKGFCAGLLAEATCGCELATNCRNATKVA